MVFDIHCLTHFQVFPHKHIHQFSAPQLVNPEKKEKHLE